MPEKILRIIWVAATCLLLHAAWAATASAAMPLRPAMAGVAAAPWVESLSDPSGKLGVDQVRQPPVADRFRPLPGGRTHMGLGAGAWWLRLEVKNLTSREGVWLLQPTHPQFDRAEMFVFPVGGKPSSLLLGDHAPFAERPLPDQTNVFPLTLGSGRSAWVYIRLAYDGPGIGDLRLLVWSPKQFGEHATSRLGLLSLMLGGFVMIALFNTFVAFSTRAPEYFWYVAYVISITLTGLAYQGLGYRFLWHDWQWFTDTAPVVFPGLALLLSTQFTRSFLKLKRTMPRIDKLLLGFIIFALVVLSLFFIGFRKMGMVLSFGNTLVGVFFPLLGLKLWLGGRREARFYTIAWTAWMASTALVLMRYLGVVRLMALTDTLPLALMLLEALLLSLALGDRINVLREQKEEAERNYLEALENSKLELERQVRDRTAEISRMHHQAVRAARTDMLTGLPNRRAFYDDAAKELERAGRYERPVSLILLDIDHFKAVNDTYGHSAGDEVLRRLADLLSRDKRGADVVGRLGGEEFALLLPETALEEAFQLAERIRQDVADLAVSHNGKAIGISASLGVTKQRPGETIEAILDRADKTLYTAKETGRNRVKAG